MSLGEGQVLDVANRLRGCDLKALERVVKGECDEDTVNRLPRFLVAHFNDLVRGVIDKYGLSVDRLEDDNADFLYVAEQAGVDPLILAFYIKETYGEVDYANLRFFPGLISRWFFRKIAQISDLDELGDSDSAVVRNVRAVMGSLRGQFQQLEVEIYFKDKELFADHVFELINQVFAFFRCETDLLKKYPEVIREMTCLMDRFRSLEGIRFNSESNIRRLKIIANDLHDLVLSNDHVYFFTELRSQITDVNVLFLQDFDSYAYQYMARLIGSC